MKRKYALKLFAFFIIGIIVISICFTSNAQTIDIKRGDMPTVSEDFFARPRIQLEEKIMEYDAITGETNEVNVSSLTKYSRSGEIISSTSGYNPDADVPEKKEDPMIDYTPYGSFYYVVNDNSTLPYKAICRIMYDDYGYTHKVSGYLVGPNLLLTAAHCIFNVEDNDACYADWVAYPAYKQGNSYNGISAGWTKIYYSDNWKLTHDAEYDWCLCVLGENLGNQTGWIGCQSFGVNSEMLGISLRTMGYPMSENNGEILCFTRGNINLVGNNYFRASSTVSAGMSGGPAIAPSYNGMSLGIIHGYVSNDPSTSVCTRISQHVIDLINANK